MSFFKKVKVNFKVKVKVMVKVKVKVKVGFIFKVMVTEVVLGTQITFPENLVKN